MTSNSPMKKSISPSLPPPLSLPPPIPPFLNGYHPLSSSSFESLLIPTPYMKKKKKKRKRKKFSIGREFLFF